MVKSVVWLRVCSVALILILPFLPSYWLASLVYVVRSALSSSLTRGTRRGFSVSMNSLAMRLTSAVGPTMSGYMLDIGALAAPFYATGVLQLAPSWLYGYWFRQFDRKGEER